MISSDFAELYPVVKGYVANRCFWRRVELESEIIHSHVSRLEIQEGSAKYLARKISELPVEQRSIEFDNADFRLSETRRFAQFLDNGCDGLRFASLGTTGQGESGAQFRVDSLKPSGALGFYYPYWVVVQVVSGEEMNWIIETQGALTLQGQVES